MAVCIFISNLAIQQSQWFDLARKRKKIGNSQPQSFFQVFRYSLCSLKNVEKGKWVDFVD